MDISLTYALSQADVEAAIRDNRRAVRGRYLFGIVVAVAVAIIFFMIGDTADLVFGILLILLALLQVWSMVVPVPRIAERWLERLGTQTTLRLTEDAYYYPIVDEDPRRDWSKSRVVAGRDYLTLVTDRKILVVPCRELSDPQRAEFARFLGSGGVRKVVQGKPAL